MSGMLFGVIALHRQGGDEISHVMVVNLSVETTGDLNAAMTIDGPRTGPTESGIARLIVRAETSLRQGSRIGHRTNLYQARNAAYQSSQAPPINPARLALIESSGADASVRRPSMQQDPPPARDVRRDQPETPSYLNGRAETTANRYGLRDSSPPTQAPPVPAFTLSFAPPTASSIVAAGQSVLASQAIKAPQEAKRVASPPTVPLQEDTKPMEDVKPEPPADAPTAPKVPPPAPKASLASPPSAAPKAPRAHEVEDPTAPNARLQGGRSLEQLSAPPTGPAFARPEAFALPARPSSTSMSPAAAPALPTLIQSVSPSVSKFGDLGASTGPRASRMSPAQASVSPHPPFASPRSDIGGFQSSTGMPRVQTPPPSAPSGPRNRSYSVSPKVTTSNIPTAPRGNRGPPIAPRGLERGHLPPARAPPPWAPPSAPRSLQWRRPGAPGYGDKVIPVKRDFYGEEKAKVGRPITTAEPFQIPSAARVAPPMSESMDTNKPASKRQSSLISGHSAAQSFFGKPDKEQQQEEEEEEDDEDTGMSDAEREPFSTSDDEESDLEEDLTLFNAKFERQKRQLEAQLADLSTRHYRATTPLESIARLARISVKDLERLHEQREHEMDVDSPTTTNQHLLPPTVHSSDSGDGPDLLTPKGEDDPRVAIRGSDDSSEGVRRVRRPSPEPIALPYLLKDAHPAFHDSNAFKENYKRHEDSQAEVLDAMEEDLAEEEDADVDIETAFAAQYRRWREECEDLDRLKEEQEKLEEQQSLEPGPEPDIPLAAPVNPILDGRRLHKNSSEYEIEQVLKQSEETARIEQERQDREAKKNQADMEKEARIPDMQTEDEIRRGTFIDSNRFREPELLTTVFSYEPPEDTFAEEEQTIFIAAFKETPKKWGEIASLLPNRTYEDCIRHYYANKWDGRFRDNRTKKLKAGGRRGRGGRTGPRGRMGGLMADLARTEELFSPDMSEKGRPRRAAAPTTFGEKEAEAKANLFGPSPTRRPGAAAKADANGEAGPEKPGKRQRRTGEKPGRKAKANQPLAALAAAPQASPTKFIHSMHNKEDLARMKQFEDASLLASLQAGHPGMLKAEAQVVYTQDGLIQHMPPPEEPERSKVMGPATAAKSSASSYWSVPEQNDFIKYIGHFGRDFAAIAAHMGTKTHTMIKNHYQRQVDGGNRPELGQAANEADERRARGEDIGPPPTPTPITKRKYDNPAPSAQRPLAPHTEMEIDDNGLPQRGQALKHASPHQYQAQPRFTTSAQNTPVPAPRVAPSPLPVSTTPAPTPPQPPATGRPQQHPLGNRFTFLPESQSEPRPSAAAAPSFHATQDTPPRTQSSQTSRTASDAPDPHYIRNLIEERDRALRMQEQYTQQERIEQLQRQSSLHRNLSQGSPLSQPLQHPPDRKSIVDERPPSPPQTNFPGSALGRPPLGPTSLGSFGAPPFSSLSNRSAFNPSPPRGEEPRPTSVSAAPPIPPPAASAPPSEPKRSNVLSLLNSEPEEPKPPKRESLPSIPQRTISPVSQTYPHTSSTTPLSSLSASRREPSFGQPSMPQSQFQHGPFGQQSSNPGPTPPSLKHEPSSSNSMPQPPKDWAVRALEQTGQQQSPSTPTFERNVRPYFSHSDHRSILGSSLGQTRAVPSPPPNQGIVHSRTPSLTTQAREPPRAPLRSGLGSQQPAQPLQPNPYASQQPLSFSQQPGGQAQNHAHHSQNNLLSNPFPSLHHRAISRDEHARREQALAAAQREREEQDARWKQRQENLEAGRRQHERYIAQQHQQEQDRQQSYHRAPPQPLQPPLGGASLSQSRSLDLRGQSRMEAEFALRQQEQERERQRMQQHQQQQQQDADRRRQEFVMRERDEADAFKRRQEESSFPRRTPLSGGFFQSRR